MNELINAVKRKSGRGSSDFLSRSRMPVIAAGAVLATILVLCAGCGLYGSGYDADYKVVSDGTFPNLAVTVKGKAAKLAVILTSPSGESDTRIIESERMITNNATVEFQVTDLQPGRYVITVKTFSPEAVVVKKNVDFSLSKLTVESVKFHLKPVRRWGGGETGEFTLEGLTIVLRKDGSLPVEIADASIMVGDAPCQFCNVASDRVMIGQQHAVAVKVSVAATERTREGERRRGTAAMLPSLVAVFAPGDRYLVKGRLILGKVGKSLDFQKELVVSQDGVGDSDKSPGDLRTKAESGDAEAGKQFEKARAPSPVATPQSDERQSAQGPMAMKPGRRTARPGQSASREAMTYFWRAETDCQRRDFDKAIADCSKAIELDPAFARAYAYRGRAFEGKGDADKAIADCSKAIELDPNDYEGYYNRGLTFYRIKEYEKVIADLSKAVELEPKNPWPHLYRGLAYNDRGDSDRAWADVKKCQALGGTVSQEHLDKLRKPTESQTKAATSADRNPLVELRAKAESGDAEAQDDLGMCYLEGRGVTQDYAEAVKWFRKAAAQNHAQALNHLGVRYAKGEGVNEDQVEAAKWIRKAAELNLAVAQNNMGRRYAQGEGVEKDVVEAYKWRLLAAGHGREKAKAKAEKGIATLEASMTREQLAEGKRRADEWREKHDSNNPKAASGLQPKRPNPPFNEDASPVNPMNCEVKEIRGSWKVVEGNHWIMDFGSNEAAARKSLRVIQFYRMNAQCFVGRPNPGMTYWKVNGESPVGKMDGEDTIAFNAGNLEVRADGSEWLVTDGRSRMMIFRTKTDAEKAISIIQYYGFTYECFVGRPFRENKGMRYFRK